MKILALDLATTTGVCVGTSGADPKVWSVYLGEAPDERRLSNVLRLTKGLIEKNQPNLIVPEAAVGGKEANAYLIGLMQCVRAQAFAMNVTCIPAHIATVRKHFIGKHMTSRDFPHLSKAAAKKAIKGEVIKRCQLLKWKAEDDNQADALAIWDYACATYARGYQAKPLGGLFNAKN